MRVGRKKGNGRVRQRTNGREVEQTVRRKRDEGE
jgi:hypothetical protein